MRERLEQLCTLHGVSGREDEVRSALMEAARPFVQKMKVDSLGNLILWRKGRRSTGHQLMLCAHMDEVGLIVTHITQEGYLKFDVVGGVDTRVILGKRILLGERRIPGVVGMPPVHLLTKEETKAIPKVEQLILDIGASSRSEAEEVVELGETAVFDSSPAPFGDGLFRGRALDDRVGCAILLNLLQKEELPLDTTFVFTAQEEVGTRGAFGAAFGVEPTVALVLETTTAADLPDVKKHRRVCQVGAGPVISAFDGGTLYDRALFEGLRDIAEAHEIPWQTKEYLAGGNDAMAIQRTRGGVRVAAISAPVRYLHGPIGVGSFADFRGMEDLTALFLEDMAQKLPEV